MVHKWNFLHQVLKFLISTSTKKSEKWHGLPMQNTFQRGKHDDPCLHVWAAKSLQITQDKTVSMSPIIFSWWVPELKIMGECLWFDVISSVWLVVRHVKWQNRVHEINFLHQVLKILINTSNKNFQKWQHFTTAKHIWAGQTWWSMFACVGCKVTANHLRQNSVNVTNHIFLMSSRVENHGRVPMIWCYFICVIGGETCKMTK